MYVKYETLLRKNSLEGYSKKDVLLGSGQCPSTTTVDIKLQGVTVWLLRFSIL